MPETVGIIAVSGMCLCSVLDINACGEKTDQAINAG